MPRIAVLTCPTPHAWIVINALVERFGPVTVLNEERQSRRDLIRKRMRRQGVIPVLGQIAFVMFQKVIEDRAKPRIDEIVREHELDPAPNAACNILPVRSVNSTACRAALAMIKPDVVLVIGTRIIGRETLAAIDAPLINYHAGINPKYRGQAGGYWALARGDPENAGVTLHLVDKGVDTGAILYQARFSPALRDNFATYYYLQAAAARPLAVKAIDDALSDRLEVENVDLPSQQFHHPTIWFYLWTAWRKGVW
jgi:folate-dependent phosphoribosylglycinamide formyltransferase PurN